MLVKSIVAAKPNTAVFTITKGETIHDAISALAVHRIGALVVSEDGNVIDGIISERDIIREIGKQGTVCLDQDVGAMMTGTVSCCSMDDTAETILTLMTEGRFRHMPIIADGKLVGLLTLGDVVKSRLEEMAQENSAMVDMIRGA